MAVVVRDLIPQGYFRRWIEGSDLSLEANTPAVPGDNRFYVLDGGTVRMEASDFAEATAAYEGLCVAYWEGRLTSTDRSIRLLAARGLFRHNHEHPVAGDLLVRQGDERDRSMVGKARHRAAFLKRKQG